MKLLATSVVRGSQQGESHGGVYLLDLEHQLAELKLDWNAAGIDWTGRGGDRGLRGIAFDGERIYITASDELFAFTPDFELLGSWRNRYLKHCHETSIHGRMLYVASTGYDSILGFDLDRETFAWAMQVDLVRFRFKALLYDPQSDDGPLLLNKLHLNNVHCNADGMYLSGLRTGGMIHFNGKTVHMSAELPSGTHNAQPFRNGVLFNDSEADRLRYSGRGDPSEDRAMAVPRYPPRNLLHAEFDDGRVARQGFARGLAVISDSVVAGGSSPSTVVVYDLKGNRGLVSVNLSMDVRNAIHGLEVWPYG